MESTVPLVTLPQAAVERLARLGAPPSAAQVPLYRAIANQPDVVTGWVELSWRLRRGATTPRRLRELLIVHTAMLSNCEYELRGHREDALANGVRQEELDALTEWRGSPFFSPEERAALALGEAMHQGSVPDEVVADLERCFASDELVELVVTCGFYNMAARVIDALGLSPDEPRP